VARAAPQHLPWRLEGRYEPVDCVVGFWSRVSAAGIDSFILGVFTSVVLFLTGILTLGGFGGAPFARLASPLLLVLGVQGAYSVLLIGRDQATLGMLWAGLSVIREDERPVGYGLALGRWALYSLPYLFLLVPHVGSFGFLALAVPWGILNPLWVCWDPKKQAVHDLACKTLVVASRPRNEIAHWVGLVLFGLSVAGGLLVVVAVLGALVLVATHR